MAMNATERLAERMRSFKKGIDTDVTRRRRGETTIQIRKNMREERLNQRRRMMSTVSDLPKIAAMIQSRDTLAQTTAVSQLRRLLSLEVINLGVVPLLVEFLRQHDRPEMQFEAAWALTNIASGTTQHTEEVINCGAVMLLCELLLSSNEDVCEQAVWALGNISGDSPQCRDLVLNSGAMMPLLAVLRRSSGKMSILRNATWTLSNFCRGKPKPDFNLVSPALMLLPHLIYSPDEEVVTDACWTLSYLSDGSTEAIQAVVDAGICRQVVDLVGHTLTSIQTPALRTIGNIVTGNEHQTQTMLDLGVLPRLVPLLKHEKKLIRKEACWAISNISAGTTSQIQEVIDANVIPPLLYQLMSVEFDVKKEAAWAISNATSGGSTEQVKYLVQQGTCVCVPCSAVDVRGHNILTQLYSCVFVFPTGCIPPLVKLLDAQDPRVVNVSLDALENILRAGEADMSVSDAENRMARYIEEADGVELIQNLQFHQEEGTSTALSLHKDYFDGEDDEEFDIAPEMDYDSRQFTFGMGGEAAAATAVGAGVRFNF
ncbi:hypothetical protein BBJ28_00018609 [Nothophytophthora sp. Chile5]|nr:hypothetical protein BBJ28_00018609 [Nothophytophthora sp. Chile5]